MSSLFYEEAAGGSGAGDAGSFAQVFGFLGLGVSFAFADPIYNWSFVHVIHKMDFDSANDPRKTALREAMYRYIKNLFSTESYTQSS